MLSVWIASSTFGSSLPIADLRDFVGLGGCAPRGASALARSTPGTSGGAVAGPHLECPGLVTLLSPHDRSCQLTPGPDLTNEAWASGPNAALHACWTASQN